VKNVALDARTISGSEIDIKKSCSESRFSAGDCTFPGTAGSTATDADLLKLFP
jgi:hypothetical protein